MKRVLFISNVPVPYRMEFFRQLSEKIELSVYFESTSGSFQYNYDLNCCGFRTIYFKGNQNTVEKWKDFLHELKCKYDYIIVGGIATKMSMVAIVFMKILGIPYFIEVDGAILRKDRSFRRMLKTFLVTSATGYFSSSDDSDTYLRRYGAVPKKIYRYSFSSVKEGEIIETFLCDFEKRDIKKRLKLDETLPVVLCVGRFIHRKGIDILLRAFSGLDDKSQVVIIGGKESEEYREISRSLNLSNVVFLDFMSKDQLSEYYRICDVFVLPTREEVWGLVINEAMSYGCPIVTTDNCVAGKELVRNGENGYIVPVDNYDELHKALEYIISNESIRDSMRIKSLSIIKSYTIENMVRDHLKIFEQEG